MALGEKKIRLGVEDEKLNKLRQSVTELGNDLIRSSRQYTTSSKETLRDLEEQIRLIEKRNKLEREASEMSVRQGVQAGAVSPEAAKSRMSEIRTASKEDMLQVQLLLRELIDTIKSTAKEEIRQDRGNVEKQIRADRSLDRLGITGDPEEALNRTIQRGMLGDISEEEVAERGRFSGRGAASALNTTAGITTSKNEFYMAAAALSVIPMIGQGLGNVANRLFSSAEKAESAISNLATANMGMTYGQAMSGFTSQDVSTGQAMGLNTAEVVQRKSSLRRTIGRNVYGAELSQAMGAERYIGEGGVSGIAGVMRYGGGDIGSLLRILEANNRDITMLTENVSAFTTAAQNSMQITSNISSDQIARSVIGIQRATGQSGIGLNQVTGAIQGLGRTGNPVTRSLMMRAFRQANPNASMFDLQAMMEDPMSALGQGQGTSEFFGNLKGLTGGGQAYNQALYSVFGGQLSRSRIRDIISGGGDFSQIAQEISGAGEGNFDFAESAARGTGAAAKSTAFIESISQEYGTQLMEATQTIVAQIKQTFDDLSMIISGDMDAKEATNRAALNYYKNMSPFMQNVTNQLSKIVSK